MVGVFAKTVYLFQLPYIFALSSNILNIVFNIVLPDFPREYLKIIMLCKTTGRNIQHTVPMTIIEIGHTTTTEKTTGI